LRLIEEISDGRYTYRGPGTLWAWFRVKASFLLLDSLRARRRIEARELPLEGFGGDPPNPAAANDPSSDRERLEILVAIDACLASLPNDNQRRALALLLYRGASYQEIAGDLDRPLNTVRTDIRRGRRALRECLIQRLDLGRDLDREELDQGGDRDLDRDRQRHLDRDRERHRDPNREAGADR